MFDVIYVDLPAVNNVKATVLSYNCVKVTWNQLSDATKYTISYASHIADESVPVEGGSTTSYTLTNLEGSTTYTITVQATTMDGRKSDLSNKVSIRTQAAGKSYSYMIREIYCKHLLFKQDQLQNNLHQSFKLCIRQLYQDTRPCVRDQENHVAHKVKRHSHVSAAKKAMWCTSVLFTGTTNSPFYILVSL